ncbi:secretoglobin family 1D member [Ailuropoda melanoleuca]|uniref:secretoglobin family 1D member n=1 Tax=Ailuropoda melanoleuca TaxID=9646 RepID=UPI0001DEC1BB|nr:secretoglobin family 1D member [Ailuropoda melanoleuca]
MRLPLSVLLVTLALCCYEANAVPCPDVIADFSEYLFLPASVYKITLEKYNPPPEVIQAKMTVKDCSDQISFKHRGLIALALEAILVKCGL